MLKNIWVVDLHIGTNVGKLRHSMFIYEWISYCDLQDEVQIALYHMHFLREENVKE